MSSATNWRVDLQTVVDLMRDISKQTDPQAAAQMYGKGLRSGKFFPSDAWVAVSRRGLEPPQYRITRSTLWKQDINPWTEKGSLPVYSSGLLGELMYSNEPQIITDLQSRLRKDDPALEHFQDSNLLVTLPQWDDGVSLNMSAVMVRDPSTFPMDRIPMMVWQSNLWGRSVLNLVLRKELKTAYDALDNELHQVGKIQRALLPTELPKIPGLELAAHYQTSQRAGGDYYDLFRLSGGRWGILIADVSGHGPPAAVIMAITHAIAHLHQDDGSSDLLSFVNRSLVKRYTTGNGTFVTAFYGIYDPADRTLRYARAGHNPPRLLRNSVVTELNHVGGLPLGLFDEEPYEEHVEHLQSGDALLFYTDGITEARDPDGTMFETDLLDKALCDSGDGADDMLAHVLDSLKVFARGVPPADDQTLLAMRVR